MSENIFLYIYIFINIYIYIYFYNGFPLWIEDWEGQFGLYSDLLFNELSAAGRLTAVRGQCFLL